MNFCSVCRLAAKAEKLIRYCLWWCSSSWTLSVLAVSSEGQVYLRTLTVGHQSSIRAINPVFGLSCFASQRFPRGDTSLACLHEVQKKVLP